MGGNLTHTHKHTHHCQCLWLLLIWKWKENLNLAKKSNFQVELYESYGLCTTIANSSLRVIDILLRKCLVSVNLLLALVFDKYFTLQTWATNTLLYLQSYTHETLTCFPPALWSWLGGSYPNGYILCCPHLPGWARQWHSLVFHLCNSKYSIFNIRCYYRAVPSPSLYNTVTQQKYYVILLNN